MTTKEKLQGKQKELIVKIKGTSKDNHAVDSYLKELVSVIKQLEVKPTAVFVPFGKDTIRIDTPAYSLIKTDDTIVFVTNGMRTVLYPTLPCYNAVDYLFVMKDIIENNRYEEFGLSKKIADDAYAEGVSSTALILLSPSTALNNMSLTQAMMSLLNTYTNALYAALNGKDIATVADDEEAIVDMKDKKEFMEGLNKTLFTSVKGEFDKKLSEK